MKPKRNQECWTAWSPLMVRGAACAALIPGLLLTLAGSLHLCAATPDFAAVQAIFNQHCLDCHAAQDPEAKLVMEDFETLMKGGESGAVLTRAGARKACSFA
jgi:mono/diheme cytochrome c family protein